MHRPWGRAMARVRFEPNDGRGDLGKPEPHRKTPAAAILGAAAPLSILSAPTAYGGSTTDRLSGTPGASVSGRRWPRNTGNSHAVRDCRAVGWWMQGLIFGSPDAESRTPALTRKGRNHQRCQAALPLSERSQYVPP